MGVLYARRPSPPPGTCILQVKVYASAYASGYASGYASEGAGGAGQASAELGADFGELRVCAGPDGGAAAGEEKPTKVRPRR